MRCPVCARENADDARTCVGCGAPLVQGESSRELGPGSLLHAGAYSISRCLASEALTNTYDGMDVAQRRFVTVVEFFPEGCRREQGSLVPAGSWTAASLQEARKKFLDEVQLLGKLPSQPALPAVYGTFEERGTAYLVTEQVLGKDVAAVLQQRGGKLVEGEAVGHAAALGEAMHILHRAGMLVLDFRLRHLILLEAAKGRTGRLVLMGWGERSSRPMDAGTASPYAAPEMFTSAPRGPVTDVYSLAALLYHLVTGVRPAPPRDRSQGKPLADVRQANPWVTPRVAAAIMRGLAMEPGRRPQGMREFVDALRFGGPTVSLASPPPRAGRKSPARGGQAPAERGTKEGPPPAPEAEAPAEPAIAPTPSPSRAWTVLALAAVVFACVVGGIMAALTTMDHNPRPAPSLPQKGALVRPSPSPPSASPQRPIYPWSYSLQGHRDAVVAVAFAPDGRQVLSGSADHTARLWDLASGKEVQAFRHDGVVRGVAFSPDGTRLATSSADGTIRVWTPDGKQVTRIQTETDPCNLAFSAGGQLLLGRGAPPLICVWNAESGALVASVKREGKVGLVAFTSNETAVASVDVAPPTPNDPLTIKVQDLKSGQVSTTIRYAEPGIGVRRPFDLPYACISADGKRALSHGPSAREEDELVAWDLTSGRLIGRHRILYLGDPLAYSPDGSRVLLTVEMRATLWDLAQGREICRYGSEEGVLHCAAFSPDGRRFVAGGHDRTVRVGTVP